MAREIKIGIEADFSNFIEGKNKVVQGLASLRNEYIKTGEGAEKYRIEMENRERVALREGHSIENLTKVYQMYSKEAAELATHLGQDNEEFKLAASLAKIYGDEINKLQAAQKAQAEAAKRAAEAQKQLKKELEEAAAEEERVVKYLEQMTAVMQKQKMENFASAIDEINSSLREMEERERRVSEINSKGADLGLMMLNGDEIGIAKYTLSEYEKQLKKTIAETGTLSVETQMMYKKYSDQKIAVENLVNAQKEQVEVTKQVKTAQAATDKTTKDVSRSFKEQTTYIQKLVSVVKNILMFQLLMSPIRNGLKGIKDLLRDSVNVAAEAEQRFSKLATVFDGLADSAKAMAQNVAGSIGVANSTSASALSTVGDLLQAQGMGTTQSLSMSAEWVKQFQDIIAFKDINMSLEEFAQNFMSGAAGNLRNFRTFGSIVKESAVNARLAAQGLDKLTGSQLELAKMTTRATIALEQQKNAMGATEREWDTMLSINRRLNEAWKEYKENLGDTLNRIIKPMKEAITEMLDDANRAARLAEQTATHQEIMAGSRPVSVLRNALTNADDAAQFKTFINELVQKAIVPNGGRADDPGSLAGQIAGLQTTNEYIEWFQKEYATQYLRQNPGASQEAANAYGLRMAQGAFSPSIESYKTNIQNGNEDLGTESLDLTNLAKTMIEFGVSIEKLKDTTDNALPDIIYENIEAYRTMIDEGLTQRSRREGLESAYNSYSAMIEAISGMKVAGTPVAGTWDFDYWNQSSGGAETLYGIIANAMSGAGSDAFTNIMGADLAKTWGDAVAIALDGLDKSNLLEGKANSLKTLYGIILEYMPEETDLLEKVAKAYQDTNKDLADYIAGIEAQKNALSAYNSGLSSLSSSTTGYNRQFAAVGLSELDAGLLELSYAFDDMKAQFAGFTDDELAKLGIDLGKLDEEYQNQVKAYTDLYNAQQAYAAMLAAQSNVSGFVTGAQGRLAKNAFVEGWTGHGVSFYNGSVTTLNKAQAGALYDYRQNWNSIKASLGTMTTNEAGQYDLGNGLLMTFDEIDHVMQDDLMQSFEDLADAVDETTSEFWKQYNPFQGTIDAYNSGKEAIGGVGGGFLGILMELLKQTEAFSELTNIVSETIVPILDAILRPLIPVLKVIETMFDVLSPLLEPLFAIIKVIATAVIEILTPIRLIFAAVNNILERIKHPITGGDRIAYKDILSETNELLKEMWDAELDIKRNTENKDLKLLESLRDRNIISTEQFYKEAGAIQGTYTPAPTTASYYPYESQSSASQSHAVQIGSLTFNLPQGDPEENARAIARMLKRLGIDIDVSAVSYA